MNYKQNIGSIKLAATGLLFILLFILCFCIYIFLLPYKEVLSCDGTECKTERFYLVKNLTVYNFYKEDKLYLHRSFKGPLFGRNYIENSVDGKKVFENGFFIEDDALKIIFTIKDFDKTKITKYLFLPIIKYNH